MYVKSNIFVLYIIVFDYCILVYSVLDCKLFWDVKVCVDVFVEVINVILNLFSDKI